MPRWAVPCVDGCDIASHEDTLRPMIDGLFPDGGVFADIGAHMGLWSIPLGLRASRVIAVEPNPAVAAILRQNIILNELANIVEVWQVAAWDENTTVNLLSPPGHCDPCTGWMRTGQDTDHDERTQVLPVPARKLDGVLRADRLDLVKVDTEGADLRALRGMSGLIARHRPVLFIESHHQLPYAYSEEELLGTVEDLGYRWQWAAQWMASHYLICYSARIS